MIGAKLKLGNRKLQSFSLNFFRQSKSTNQNPFKDKKRKLFLVFLPSTLRQIASFSHVQWRNQENQPYEAEFLVDHNFHRKVKL
jgi:hypothetical protein